MLTQPMSSYATPCSRMNFVTVLLGLLDLQGVTIKENLKKEGGGIKMQDESRRISQSFLTSFCPSMKEEQDSKAYKTLKQKPTNSRKQNRKSRHCGSVESMVGKILLTER